tara:strand:+ start:97 stop:642 length:546 start_codon:yes stop_codon:yes gene_type:complete
MVKNTFFLRDSVRTDSTNQTRQVTEIDLGAFVNLGSTKPQLLRIHSIQIQYCDSNGAPALIDAASTVADGKSAFATCSLTTKSTLLTSPYMPVLSEDETVFTSSIVGTNLNDDKDQGIMSDAMDLAPQHLMNGYLIGVDTLYLYGICDDAWDEDIFIHVCMECSTEPANKENAVNLALSQI